MRKFILPVLMVSVMLTACAGGGKTASDVMNGEADTAPTLAPLKEDAASFKPAEVNPAEQSEDSVGNMTFYPYGDSELSALAGMNTFTFYFEKSDVTLNEGRIGLYYADAEDDPLCSVADVTDENMVQILPIDEEGKSISGFDDGKMAVVNFDTQFEAGKKYYVLLDSGCFKRGNIVSAGIANASYITFSTKDYGIVNSLKDEYTEGDSVDLHVILNGDAATATIGDYNDAFLSFSQDDTENSSLILNKTGDIRITFKKRTVETIPATFRLRFIDRNGQGLDECLFAFKILPKAPDADLHSAT